MPLSDMPPSEARRLLLKRPQPEWRRWSRKICSTINSELEGAITGIDVWRWGHAMIRRRPAFSGSAPRRPLSQTRPPLFLAHSDLSGLSLFEEAHYRGAQAAEGAMRHSAAPTKA